MKKVLLILGVILIGLTSCKKEDIEKDNCDCGFIDVLDVDTDTVISTLIGPVFTILYANYITECGDIVYVCTFDENLDDTIIPTDNDTIYWYIMVEDDITGELYRWDGSTRFMTIKENGVYKNCQ